MYFALSLILLFSVSIVFGYVLVRCALSCPRPLPGPGFPFQRCSGSCEWCDHIDEFERSERSRELGPYRERARLPRTKSPLIVDARPEPVIRRGQVFPSLHVRIPDPPADLPEGPEQNPIKRRKKKRRKRRKRKRTRHPEVTILVMQRERIGRQLLERERQAREEVDEELVASGIVLHGDRSEST